MHDEHPAHPGAEHGGQLAEQVAPTTTSYGCSPETRTRVGAAAVVSWAG